MSNRMIDFVPGEFFHIYNRGNSKQKIFLDAHDYRRFMTLLFVSNSTEAFKLFFLKEPYSIERGSQLVSIGAYCLMPNHFHILLTPTVENGISIFMRKLMTGYSMYFNNRYKRTGSLFEGRFKGQHANNDTYLKYLYSYIHLNPLKLIQSDWKEIGVSNIEGGEKYLREYQFSSYKDFIGETRVEKLILDSAPFPEYFPTAQDFEKEVFSWFEQNKQVLPV